jgi:uncharacterized membrane protein
MEQQFKKNDTDKNMQYALAKVLRIGVWLATATIALGGMVYLYSKASTKVVFDIFKPQDTAYISVPTILNGLTIGNGLAIVQLGVLLLIFMPIIRVIFAVVSFLKEKDYLYVTIGTLVLLIIFLSSYFEVVH